MLGLSGTFQNQTNSARVALKNNFCQKWLGLLNIGWIRLKGSMKSNEREGEVKEYIKEWLQKKFQKMSRGLHVFFQVILWIKSLLKGVHLELIVKKIQNKYFRVNCKKKQNK